MPTPIGRLIQRVQFEQPTAVPDGSGGYTQTWAPIPPAPWKVSIRPATSRDLESETASTVSASASHIVTGAYHAGVSTAARMVRLRDGRKFSIDGVTNDDERDVTMTLFCTELLDAPEMPNR